MCRKALEVVWGKPNLDTVEFNTYHETGFELDIFHPESRLNIELDGPYHRSRLARDNQRDRVLAQHNITVKRLSCVGRSLESLTREVLQLLESTFNAAGP